MYKSKIEKNLKNGAQCAFLSLPLIILVGLVIRLGILAIMADYPERGISPDSESYLRPGISLVSTGIYPHDSGKRTPIYPLFIALVYFFGGQNPILIMAAQVLLDTITIYLTYLLGSWIFPRPVALIGTLIMAINVDSITFDFYYLSETLSTLLTLAALLAWVKGYLENSRSWLVVGAILMGCSVLTRPIVLYFPIGLIIWLLLKKERQLSKRLGDAVIYSLVFLFVLMPWVVRNYNVIGLPTVSTISNYNLLFFNAASLEAHVRGIREEQVRKEYIVLQSQKMAELGLENTYGNKARVQSVLAKEVILSHPFQYIYVHLKSDLNSFLPDTNILELLGLTTGGKGTLNVLNEKGLIEAVRHYFGENTWLIWVLIPAILLLGFIYATGLIGSVQLIKEGNWFALIVLVTTCAYFLLLPGAPSIARFRVPIMPYLSLLSGLGTCTVRKFWQARKFR